MPGLVPGIHVLDESVTVDGRDKPGHYVQRVQLVLSPSNAPLAAKLQLLQNML
jgi:hypothetical protein